MKGQLIAAIVENITTRKDRSLKVVIGTQEVSPSEAGQLFQYMHQLVTVYVCPSAIDNRELEQIDKLEPELNNKSQSQRIRNVLYLLHQQASEGFKTFDEYYKAKTELYIEHLKSKLNP
jgi:hypothetical protein